jgi:hypothetical protein
MITIMIIMMMIVLLITNSNNSSSCDISNNSNNDNENSDNLLFSALFVRDWVSSFFMYGFFSLITRVTGLKS